MREESELIEVIKETEGDFECPDSSSIKWRRRGGGEERGGVVVLRGVCLLFFVAKVEKSVSQRGKEANEAELNEWMVTRFVSIASFTSL